MAKRAWLPVLALSCFLAASGGARAAEVPEPNLKPLLGEVRKLLGKHYPEGVVTLTGHAIHFESDTRTFLVHEPLLTGEWQDAREEVGPRKGGIYGDIELHRGEYNGMAVVPQSFDKRYFTLLLLAPYSEKADCHLYVRLKYPRDAPEGFLEEFERLVGDFERHVQAISPGDPPGGTADASARPPGAKAGPVPRRLSLGVRPLPGDQVGPLFEKLERGERVPRAVLHAALIGPQTTLRADAARALAEWGDESSVPHLIRALTDDSGHVGRKYLEPGMSTTRYWAEKSLAALTGEDFKYAWDAPAEERNAAVLRWSTWWQTVAADRAAAELP